MGENGAGARNLFKTFSFEGQRVVLRNHRIDSVLSTWSVNLA